MNDKTIKLNKKSFMRFLSLIKLENDLNTSKCVIKLHNGIMEVCNRTTNKVVVMLGKMKVSYMEDLTFCIDDIDMLLKILNNISSEEINIKILTSKIAISGEKSATKASLPITKEEFVTTNLPIEKFEGYKKHIGTNSLILEKNVSYEFIKLTKLVGSDEVTLECENKEVKFYTENKQNELFYSFNINKDIEPFKLRFSKLFINLINVIDDNIEMLIKDSNSPIILLLKEKDLTFEFLIGPLTK